MSIMSFHACDTTGKIYQTKISKRSITVIIAHIVTVNTKKIQCVPQIAPDL